MNKTYRHYNYYRERDRSRVERIAEKIQIGFDHWSLNQVAWIKLVLKDAGGKADSTGAIVRRAIDHYTRFIGTLATLPESAERALVTESNLLEHARLGRVAPWALTSVTPPFEPKTTFEGTCGRVVEARARARGVPLPVYQEDTEEECDEEVRA